MKEKKSKRVIVRITESQFNNLMECVIDEQIKIIPCDYYYSNSIARSSKTMSECKYEKIDLKNTGTEG